VPAALCVLFVNASEFPTVYPLSLSANDKEQLFRENRGGRNNFEWDEDDENDSDDDDDDEETILSDDNGIQQDYFANAILHLSLENKVDIIKEKSFNFKPLKKSSSSVLIHRDYLHLKVVTISCLDALSDFVSDSLAEKQRLSPPSSENTLDNISKTLDSSSLIDIMSQNKVPEYYVYMYICIYVSIYIYTYIYIYIDI
jgi:hypothetical protein